MPLFSRLSNMVRDIVGSPKFTGLLLLVVLIWLISGPLVGFSKAWELGATTGAPIIALVLLVVLQHTQNRDDKAIQLKLDEVIRASEHASDRLIGIEDSPEVELSRLLSDYRQAGTGGLDPASLGGHEEHAGRSLHRSRRPASMVGPGRAARRQRRRYAEGDLGPDHSFIFRSPQGSLNVGAQNLVLFSQLAQAVDDDTWLYHLRRGDYSRWFRDVIQDEGLAGQAARLEEADDLSAQESRYEIVSAIAQDYPVSLARSR